LRGKPIILAIAAARMAAKGATFLLSGSRVWIHPLVPWQPRV